VREGAKKAGRTPPRTYAYVRLAVGAGAQGRLQEESDRYAAIPAYAAHFERMGVKPIETAIAAAAPDGVRSAVAAWAGAVDEVVFRAITARDTVDDTLALVRAAAPTRAR
jgi:hypothetical protein